MYQQTLSYFIKDIYFGEVYSLGDIGTCTSIFLGMGFMVLEHNFSQNPIATALSES